MTNIGLNPKQTAILACQKSNTRGYSINVAESSAKRQGGVVCGFTKRTGAISRSTPHTTTLYMEGGFRTLFYYKPR